MTNIISKQNAISLLADEINRGNLTIFVGTELSISAGIPSRQRIIQELLKKYHVETRDGDLFRLASRLEEKAGALEFRQQFAQRLVTKPNLKTSLHETLAELDVNHFITSNYDHVLEDSFRKRGYLPNVIVHDKDLQAIDLSKKTIVKLHGDTAFPRSLLLTRRDHTRFRTSHRELQNWLDAIVAQSTVLFLCTSFDSLRIEQADEHALGFFHGFERQSVIFLKRPSKEGKPKDQFEIESDDYVAICEDFKERGFLVLGVDNYAEVETLLRDLHKKALAQKVRTKSTDPESALVIQSKYIVTLEQTVEKLLDVETARLCKHVRGNGRLPPPLVMIERSKELIHHLEDPPHALPLESQLEGWLTVVDALLNSDNKDDIFQARKYFDNANLISKDLRESERWRARFNRVAAKLLFFEGKPEQALGLVSKSDDDKSIGIWLSLLIDSGCFGEAYDYVSTHTVSPLWAGVALVSMVHTGHVQEAEELFRKTTTEFKAAKENQELGDSPYENEFFYERICAVFASSLFRRALQLTNKFELGFVLRGDLTDEGEGLCRKALQAIDLLFKASTREDVTESYFATMGTLVEIAASSLLQEWERADNAARFLMSIRPIPEEAARYIVGSMPRKLPSSDFLETLGNLRSRLSKDHPNKAWAFVMIANLEALAFKNDKESWSALQQAAELAGSVEEKQEVCKAAFEIGQIFNHIDNARIFINDILPTNDLWRKYLMACLCFIEEDFEGGEHLLAEIENLNPPVEIKAKTKWAHAKRAIAEHRWEEAKKLLEESMSLFHDPSLLKDLLKVLTELQDSTGALKVIEEIEFFGMSDPQVTHIKAQAARIEGQFTKAEEAWRLLAKEFDQVADYAYGLADVLVQMGQLDAALQALESFIRCDESTNLACLMLACQIYEMKEDDLIAFALLQKCRDRFQNEPSLLVKHIELGHRTDHDEAAHDSLMRLEALRQEGGLSEEAFTRISSDQLLEVLNKRRKSFEKISHLYQTGQIPRFMLCQWKNMSLYLDWAVRTQELSLPPMDPSKWTDFTTYSTNSMRVQLTPKLGNQLVPIEAPRKVSEIVIDYHALITVHRLGLLEKLAKRYSRVYYPRILNLIWATDQKRFAHHQRSEERAYRHLNKKLLSGRIIEIVAPEPGEKADVEEDNLLRRNLRLARLENLLFIDAYAEEEKLTEFPDVKVFRLAQLVEWLYGRGRLGEKQFRELRDLSRGAAEIVKESIGAELSRTNQLIVDDITLRVMEKYGLTDVLLGSGIRIVVEKATGDVIRRSEMELDFGREVGIWHRELAHSVKELNFFLQVQPRIDQSERSQFNSLGDEAVVSPLKYAEEKALFLLTDDRWTQMFRSKKLENRQFGVDALLSDLYERDIISLGEYANSFLQLCKWRYRFLIPDVKVLLSFASQYKSNPLGRPLSILADYGHRCMEDPGLFMGLEPTNPPSPLGLKFHFEWNNRWAGLLARVWQDDDFSGESREQITRKVLLQCILAAPKGIAGGQSREHLARLTEKNIMLHLFMGAIGSRKPDELHRLFSHTFDILGYDKDRQISELISCFELIAENRGQKNKRLSKSMAINVQRAVFGETWQRVDPRLLPSLEKCGFTFMDKSGAIESEQIEGIGTQSYEDVSDLFARRESPGETMPKYIANGPAFTSKHRAGELIIPHNYVFSPIREERLGIIKEILRGNYITEHTKKLIRQKSEGIGSSKEAVWKIASNETRYALLKDFHYTRALFDQFIQPSLTQLPEKLTMDLTNEAWTNVTTPDLATVLDELPLLLRMLQNRFEKTAAIGRIVSELTEFLGSAERQVTLSDSLDWYLKNVYFIPIAKPLNPWDLIVQAFQLSGDQRFPSLVPIAKVEVLRHVREWLKDKTNPLAHLMALDLTLCARGSATPVEEKSAFITEDFYEFLDELLEKLLLAEPRARLVDVQKEGVPEHVEAIRTVWKMQVLLARYYLKYIDLYDKIGMGEEMAPPLAWWMASEVCASILSSVKHFETQDWLGWIKNEIHPSLQRQNDSVSVSHLLCVRKKQVSPSRYRTLDENGIPLFVATLSMLMPHASHDADGVAAFDGLIHPAKGVSPEIRDLILGGLSLQAHIAEGQLQGDEGVLPLLWDTPLCVSAPSLLEAYYGEDISFLGEEKINIINLAKLISEPDLLSNVLANISKSIVEHQDFNPLLVLSTLRTYLMTHAEMPKEAVVFKESKTLADSIMKQDPVFQTSCLIALTLILQRLQELDNPEWAEVIGNIFCQIDYSGCSDPSLKAILLGLIGAVLMGHDYSLLRPILEKKGTDKRVRRELERIKPMLEHIFPEVPVLYRENLRRILNDLEDIPARRGNDVKGVEIAK